MRPLWEVLYLAVLLFELLLIGRFVFEIVQSFARDWHPKGPLLVIAELIYTVTDPPLKLIRRLIPPIPLGGIVLDLGLLILFILTGVVLTLLRNLAS